MRLILLLLLVVGISFLALPTALASVLSVTAILILAHWYPVRYPTREKVVANSRKRLSGGAIVLVWTGIITTTALFFVFIFGLPAG